MSCNLTMMLLLLVTKVLKEPTKLSDKNIFGILCTQIFKPVLNHVLNVKEAKWISMQGNLLYIPFDRIHMDFLGPLKETKEGYKYILLIIDSFSKFPEAFPTFTQEATEMVKILYNGIICQYGAPRSILTDKGQCFMSKSVKEICKIFQITKINTCSYNPQGNATAERFNSVINQTLRIYCHEDQARWPELLPSLMLAYRSFVATQSSQYSPFFLLYGRECRFPLDIALVPSAGLGRTINEHIEDFLEKLEFVHDIAKENIQLAQKKYKHQHDKKAKEPDFYVGQRVWLYNPATPKGSNPKMILITLSWQIIIIPTILKIAKKTIFIEVLFMLAT